MSDGLDSTELAPLDHEPQGIATLVRQLAEDSRVLLQQEIALAKLEVRQTVTAVARSSGLIAGGVLFLVLGLLVLLVFVIIALGALLGDEYWLSTLIVGSVLALLGAVLLMTGRKGLKADHLKPERTASSVRETREWAADEARDFKRQLTR